MDKAKILAAWKASDALSSRLNTLHAAVAAGEDAGPTAEELKLDIHTLGESLNDLLPRPAAPVDTAPVVPEPVVTSVPVVPAS